MKQHAGEFPHGAVLKELEELQRVSRASGGLKMLARERVRRAADPDLMRQAGVALHDHATTVAWNVDAARTGSTQQADTGPVARVGVGLCQIHEEQRNRGASGWPKAATACGRRSLASPPH